jgi:rubrerythrin
MLQQGDTALAAQFATLAEVEDHHAVHVAERGQALLGRAPDPAWARWDLPASQDAQEEEAGATLSAYQALAFAVRNEERAFAFYTYVAAEAVQPDVRTLAEDLARDELQHAALLRHHRRRAFHADRPDATERPETVDALRALARRWDAEAAAAHTTLSAALDAVGETDDAAIFRRLAAHEADAARGTAATAIPALRSAADGLRLVEAGFDRYALIGERADDEHVVAEAQRLAGDMLARLALAGGARRNALLGASAG